MPKVTAEISPPKSIACRKKSADWSAEAGKSSAMLEIEMSTKTNTARISENAIFGRLRRLYVIFMFYPCIYFGFSKGSIDYLSLSIAFFKEQHAYYDCFFSSRAKRMGLFTISSVKVMRLYTSAMGRVKPMLINATSSPFS